jgi:hypothetical protein
MCPRRSVRLLAPAHPRAVTDKLNAQINISLRTSSPLVGTPQAFTDLIKADIASGRRSSRRSA